MAEPGAGPQAQTLWYVQAAERVWGPFPQARLSRFVAERRLTPSSLVASQPGGPFGAAGRRSDLAALFEPGDPFHTASPSHAVARDADAGAPEPFAPEPFVHPSSDPCADGATAADVDEPNSAESATAPRRGELVPLRPRKSTPRPDEPAVTHAATAGRQSQPLQTQPPQPHPAEITAPAPAPAVSYVSAPRLEPPAAVASPSRALLVSADLSSLSSVAFESALAEQGRFAGVRLDMWLVRTPLDATALRNRLSRRLGAEDTLLVVDAPLDRAAWFNLDPEAEWNLRQLWNAPD